MDCKFSYTIVNISLGANPEYAQTKDELPPKAITQHFSLEVILTVLHAFVDAATPQIKIHENAILQCAIYFQLIQAFKSIFCSAK